MKKLVERAAGSTYEKTSRQRKMASDTSGVKPFPIAGRMARERERTSGMTDSERQWRKQWLKDQELSPNEPRPMTEEFYKARYNPIRRAYRKPLDFIFTQLKPFMGERAVAMRWWTGKWLMVASSFYLTYYYYKYNTHDWTRQGGWYVKKSRSAIVPGDPGYPRVSDRTDPSDYADRGFKKSVLYK